MIDQQGGADRIDEIAEPHGVDEVVGLLRLSRRAVRARLAPASAAARSESA